MKYSFCIFVAEYSIWSRTALLRSLHNSTLIEQGPYFFRDLFNFYVFIVVQDLGPGPPLPLG